MSVHIIVCIKSVVKAAPKGVAKRTPENSELNPFDRPALEAALEIREHHGGSVTVLTMGPPVSTEVLAEAQAMGTDRAVLVSDRALAESDTLVTSKVLATAINKIGTFDLLFFGTRTADSDTGQVGPQTAALLDIAFVSSVKTITAQKEGWEIERTMDAWEENWQVASPMAATIDPRAFAPRPVGLVGISNAYEEPAIEQWSLTDLGLDAEEVGLMGSPTRVAALEQIKRNRKCDMLEGEPHEQVAALMARLTMMGAID
ncbi:electron transfer flavoprotein subunit beta/FixA family protein [Thermodesulfobacteriota bacterium]